MDNTEKIELTLDIKLIQLVNSFQNTIALNNLLVKEKILRKLHMISSLRYYGFPIMNYPLETGNKIIDQLMAIDKTGDIVQYKEKTNNTNKLLGDILHNAYQYSGYNILLSNIPEFSITNENAELIQVDAEAIYDTLVMCASHFNQKGESMIEKVLQISGNSYLAKVKDFYVASDICKLLNNKMMVQQIIKVEFIEPIISSISDAINTIDTIDNISTTMINKSNSIYSRVLDNIIQFKNFIVNRFHNMIYHKLFGWFIW
jgi:hypothetical protein